MNSICIICSLYPNAIEPTNQVFVQRFAWAMADLGVECTVICPTAINLHPALAKLCYSPTEITDKGSVIKVYFPKFISFGQRNVFGYKTAGLTTNLFYKAVYKVWQNLEHQPEVVYGHFLTPAGICASRISRAHNIPSFAGYGEDSPWSIFNYGKKRIKTEIANLSGIIAVSSASKKDLGLVNVFPLSKIGVFPNGIRSNFFYPRNKSEARKKFGFDQHIFIVAFMGSFIERKGVLRVAEAVNGLENVCVAFAGNGPDRPRASNCIYNNVVKPENVPDFLSAADVFVLPTLSEGCCNAIIEAMACGLPIISSNLPFNADILNDTNSILVDPRNIEEIRRAIVYLRDEPNICKAMSAASVAISKKLSIETRVKNIYSWIKEMTWCFVNDKAMFCSSYSDEL